MDRHGNESPVDSGTPQNIMDNEFFRQKGAGQVSTGQEQEAIDANPSEQSGTNVRMGAPVWKQFVVNKAFQEANQAGIQAERDQMRMAEAGNRRASRPGYGVPMFKGGGGKLIRVLGGRGEELDPEEWTNDPEAGPIARKSLWDREIKTAKREASDSAFRLKDPAFHAKSLKDKDREDFLAEGDGLAETDPRHIELKAKLKADDEYRAEKDRLAKHSYDREAYARQLEVTDPETWFQNRSQPTAADSRAALVAETQAKRSEVTAADNSAADEGRQIRAEFAQGVKGPEVAAKQARLAEIAAARGTIAQEAVKAEEPVKQAQADARGFIDNTVTALKRGYAGAAQASNILQGATDATNAKDIAGYEAMKQANPASKEFQDFMQADGFAASAMAFIKNPVRIITEVIAESAAQMVPGIALGAVGGSIGGAVVAAPTAEVAAPATVPIGAAIGAAVGAGSGSGLAEYGSAMMESMQEAGMDATRPESIQKFFSDPEKLAVAREFAIKRGVTIGIFDAVSAGLAGKFVKPIQVAVKAGEKVGAGRIIAATGKEIGAQAMAGATGEASGQLVSKGEISDGKSIFLEGIAEVGSGPFEVAGNLREFGKNPDGTPATPEDFKPQIDTALAAIDPEISPADPAEIERAVLLGGRGHGPAEVAQAVLIERELVEIEAQEAAEIAAADAAIAAAVDPKERKAAEGNRELLETGRADTVRAVVKIAAGQNPHDLTVAELASLGMVREGDEVFPMDDKEREKAGISEPMADVGPDGSVILTDAAIKRVKAASPTAGARIAMPEATARQKAQQRADQISADSQNGGPGDPVTGSSPGGEGVPIETNAAAETSPTEFDVPMRDGTVLRVNAPDADTALQEAAAVAAITGQPATPVSSVTNTQGLPSGQGQPANPLDQQAQVPLPQVPAGASPSSNPVAAGGKPAGAGPAQAQGQGAVKLSDGTEPNKNGVFPKEKAEAVEYRGKKATATVHVAQLANGKWIASGEFGHSQGTMTGMGGPLEASRQIATRELAIAAEAMSIMRQNEGVATDTSPGSTDSQREEAKKIVEWARELIATNMPGQTMPWATDTNSSEAPSAQPTKALATAKAKLAKIRKKSPKIAAALNVTNDPAARAEAKPDGTIVINPERVIAEAMRGGMNETQAADYFDRVLDEEIRHAAQYAAAAMLWKVSGSKLDLATWRESHYAGIWKSDFSGKKGDAARDLYTRTDAGNLAAWDAMSDGDKALEAIRIMSQDQVTEEAIFLWTNISDTLRTALKAALQSLKSLAQAASPTLHQEITNLENALRSLTESQPRRRSPKADPAQPAQGGESAGNAPPAPQAGAGEAASGRGAVPPRSEGTGAPLAVGARVEFEINGRTVTGVVRDVRDGVDVASVRLDENPDVPVRLPKKNLRVIESETKPQAAPAIEATAGGAVEMNAKPTSDGEKTDVVPKLTKEIADDFYNMGFDGVEFPSNAEIVEILGRQPTAKEQTALENLFVNGQNLGRGIDDPNVKEYGSQKGKPASPTTDEAIDQMAENTRANLAEFDAETKRLDAERAKAGASESPDLDKFVTAYSNYHLARIAREAKSGKQSPEYYDQQRAAWTPDNVRDRVIEFLKVIDTKDVATLDVYNNGLFDGFWKLFGIRTGMSPMPKTQTGIADVIRSYVGDEAWNANEKANEAARAKRAEESAAKDEEWRIRGLKADAARVQFKDGQNGEQWVDEVLADGWRVENVSNGPIPRYAFRKGDLEKGFGDKKQAKPLIAYAREAQKDMADPVDEEAAREEAEFNALPQEEQEAMNSLFAPGGTKPIPAKPALTPDEQALEAFLEDIGGGLETSPLTPSEFYRSKGIPKDKRAAFLDVADQLYEAGVRTPADLAAKLSKIGGGKFKQYSHALWGGMVSSYPDLPNAEDWAGVYAALDQPANRDAETDAEFSSTKGKVMQKVANDVRDLLLADENVTVDRVKGLRPEVSTLSRKELDEAIEAGITAAARKAVQGGRSPEGVFKRLLGIYINQPSLNAKTSTSKINQAYSTPSPLAYVASRLADIAGGKVLTEPTGGHGMLMMESTADQVVQFNEIDQARHERTRLAIPESAGWKMTGEDATSWAPAQAPDRIAANPPFGSVMAEDGSNIAWITVAGKTTSIDHAIMLKQLGSMTPDGRAVFIIGGPAKTARSESARKEHYGRGAKAEFFKHLHDNFGVVDHFTVDGDLYAKQGAGWNVDVIVIQGRKASRTSLPSAKAPRMLATWDEVFQTTQLTDEQRIQLNRISEEEVRDSVRGMVDALAGIGNVGRPQAPGARPESSGKQDGAGGATRDAVSSEPSEAESGGNQGTGRVDGERNGVDPNQPAAVDAGSNPVGEGTGTRGSSQPSGDPAGTVRTPVKESGKFQAEYTPYSGAKGLDTLLPKNMVGPVADAFERIKRDLGSDLTKFVHEKLGYPDGTDITQYLAGEQIDAVAAAIWNFERGGALIVGDQTGIGKGRIAAALMKYAVKQGFTPVFMTKDPGLHDAMLTEDLPDIASPEIIPAVMDTKLQFDSAKKRKLDYGQEYFAEAASTGSLPGKSNALFVTYSQIQADDAKGLTKRDRATARNAGEAPPDKWRMRALRRLAPNAVFILDESHLASGQSTTGWRVADILRRSTRVYYSSATSVKRPENMGIYFKTNVGKLTGGNMQELTDLMNKGGVPAMQVVSSMLAKDGQYLRRERSFDGVAFTTQIAEESADRDRALADGLTGSLREIVTVQDAMRQAAEAINGVIAQTGKRMGVPAANRAKLETVNFSSKLHNIVSQYLLAIKTQSAADTAIREIKAGKKVVVAVQSTMESAIDALEFGGFEMSYKGLVLRYLDQMRFLTSGNKAFGRGEVETFEITEKGLPEFEDLTGRELEARIVTTGVDEETGDTVVLVNEKVAAELMRRAMWDVYANARDQIEKTDLGDLPLSPIDSMRQAVEREGIRTGEITGRKRGIDEDGEIYSRSAQDISKPARRVAQSAFNNEDLDFLVINQSGSTGISLHASEKAKVQSTRVMIVAQPNLDINEFMQTLGRIHRSGQVVKPEFILLQTALPAEKRPAAILGKKMSMLNANTTSNAKTDVSEGNTAVDIFNQYGDEVAYKVFERDRDLQDQLRPLGSSLAKFFNEQTGNAIPFQDAQRAIEDQPDGYIARTITGYLAILPVEEQELFWEKTIADYQAYISYLDQIGQNALEAKALDLQAKTISSETFTEKGEGDSAFADPSFIETVETKVGKAPLTGEAAVALSKSAKDGSKAVLQKYIADADAAASLHADQKSKKAVKPWDGEKRAEFLSNQRAQRNVIASAISLVGRFGSVKRNDGNSGLGVIEEIRLDDANPLTPSKQVAILRVNDSRETLRVPVTQLNEAFTPAPNESAKEWDDSLDIGGESAIATGNLMAAMKALGGAGKVITYTTDAGVDQMGILLPKSFLTKRAAIKARVNVDSSEKLIEMLDSGVRVTNGDGSIKWTKGATIVSLSVPAARATGGNIWRNPMLNRTSVGGEFTQVGNEMRATYYLKDVPAVFELLINAGETFSSEKPKESAVSDDTAAFGQFIDQQEGRLQAASIPAADISPFFSQLSRAIEAKMPKQTTPAQVIQIAMSGAKAEEVKWSGLVPAAQALAVDGKVSKEAVLKYLADEGAVRLEEVTLGVSKPIEWKQSGQSWSARSGKWSFDVEKLANGKYRMGVPGGTYSLHNSVAEFKAEAESMRERVGDSAQESPTKFAQYTLPGGENYREVVLAMPHTTKPQFVIAYKDGSGQLGGMTFDTQQQAEAEMVDTFPRRTDLEIQTFYREKPISEYTSSHFPNVPNYVAHMRTNERDGGLFIEELQSDRHQAGRKQGYKEPRDTTGWTATKKPAVQRPGPIPDSPELWEIKDAQGNSVNFVQTALAPTEADAVKKSAELLMAGGQSGVADAPFRTTWPLALFKRALRDAVAGGKDWIGWTVGETQNDRFDLSKQVDVIYAWPDPDSIGSEPVWGIQAEKNGTVEIERSVKQSELADVVGKEVAQRIVNREGDVAKHDAEVRELRGDNLKVGGSGMKGFYDTMLPKEIGKYVKQWGGKVEKEAILSEAPKDMDEGRFYNSEGQWMNAARRNAFDDGFTLAEIPIWRIDITPAMKAGVRQGQSLFAATIPAADSSGQSPSENVDPSSNATDRIAPGDKGESGLSPEGEIRRSRELAIAVFRGEAAASRSHLSEGSESVVERVGQDWTIKTIVPKGVMSYTRDGKLTRSTSFADVELKARFINLLGGFETHAVEDAGQSYLIQRYGKGFVSESELENLSLPFNLKAGHVNRVQLDGKEFIISDLHHKNFRRDENGKIRIIDLIVSEVKPSTSPLIETEDGLLAATIPAAQNLESLKQRGRVAFAKARPLIEEAEGTIKDFGAGSLGVNPKFANFGGANQDARNQVDIVRAYDTFAHEVRKDRDTFSRAKELLAKDPDGVYELALQGAYSEGGHLGIGDHQQLAIEMLAQRLVVQANGDTQKIQDAQVLIWANQLNRKEAGRLLRIGFDKFMTPAERANQQLSDMIFKLHPKIEKRAATMTLKERKAFFLQAGENRVKEVDEQLQKRLGIRLAQVLRQRNEANSKATKLEREILKLKKVLDQGVIQQIKNGATPQDVQRRYKVSPEEAAAMLTAHRDAIAARLMQMLDSGMTEEQIRDAEKDSLKTSPLIPGNAMTPAEKAAVVARMMEDYKLPSADAWLKQKALPKTPKVKTPKEEEQSHVLSTDWSKPKFYDGLNGFEFDTNDRAGIMDRVEKIRMLAGAVGSINSLTGAKLEQAKQALAEIDTILAKYGTDAEGVLNSDKGIESYGFDPTDMVQMAAVARTINQIDADWIDKTSEFLYANMLWGPQTALVNATAAGHAVYQMTVGRGVEMAMNHFVNDPMAAQFGEVKYIIRALKPGLKRAMSNFHASWLAQHPMVERDMLGSEVDWEAHAGGFRNQIKGGVIGGKFGDMHRTPLRILSATDDFNKTLFGMAEAAAFSYRLGVKKSKTQGDAMFGKGPGTPEFEKFMRVEMNTPGSFSMKMGVDKASRMIFAQALPGQKNHYTGETERADDIGGVIGLGAAKLNEFVSSGDHDNIAAKAMLAMLRISFFPFQRTPFNIVRTGMRYAPNPISMADILWGGVSNSRQMNAKTGKMEFKWNAQGRNPELIERMGQQLQGAVVMTALMALAAGEGDDDDQDKAFVITGTAPWSPAKRAEKDARDRSGVGSYRFSFMRKDGSERFGFSYARIEPLATALSTTIDTLRTIKRISKNGGDASDIAANTLGGLVAQTKEKTFMRGFSDMTDLITNAVAADDVKEPNQRKMNQFLVGRIAMAVPNFIKQPLRETDSSFRERSDSFGEELMYQVFPHGQKAAKVDPYGEKLEKQQLTGIGAVDSAARIIDVADTGTDTVNPIDRMLLRWRDGGKWKQAADAADRKPWFPAPIMNAEFKHSKTGQNVKMNGGQLAEFREKAGKRAMVLLKAANLNTQNPTARDVEKVKEIISKSRSDIKKMLAFKFSR